jgi:glycogen(starch) synthase
MRVLHVAWEYPPLIYGGLGRHVDALTRAQSQRGDDVVVLTQAEDDQVWEEDVRGVRVIRAPHDPPRVPFREDTLLAWVLGMQTGMLRAARGLEAIDIVHAHDWVTAHAAIGLRDALPSSALVATMHATEAGRHQGWLPGPLSDAIHSIEHWLVHEAQRVIVCSQHMRAETHGLFDLPPERTSVIANGIELRRWRASSSLAARARDTHAPHGPLVVFVGRLEWEKGAHTFIDALPRLKRRNPGLRAVIAGRGGHEAALTDQVRARRLGRTVDFVGWLPEPQLHALIAAADILVVPSIYEPFGLVAIEGAALGTPLVVARTGGLAEFVQDGVTGNTFEPGDAADLADAVTDALHDDAGAQRMARAARARLREYYGWSRIADETDAAYAQALATPRATDAPSPRIPDRSVNLLRP